MSADLLELEHVFGYSGKFQSTVQYHKTDPSLILYTIGSLIVLEDVNNKHSQWFLKGHDNEVTCLAVSNNGQLIASGQLGSPFHKHHEAPVILWSFQSKSPLTQFSGLLGRTIKVEFSRDSLYLSALTEEGRLVVWDCRDGSSIYNRRGEFPVTAFAWGAVGESSQGLRGANRHNSYTLVTAYPGQVTVNYFDYDISSMSYKISVAACQLPSAGMSRVYTCATCNTAGDYFFAGTNSGEIIIFNIQNRVFRASIPLSSNGLLSLLEHEGVLFAGSGDGKIKRLVGMDNKWSIVAEAQLPGKVVSIGMARELIAGTSLGCIFRLMVADLTNTLHSESPIGPVRDVSFGLRSDMFLVIDAAGFARIWDSSDYTVVLRVGPASRVEGLSCAVGEDGSVFTGWKDGYIRCYDPQTSALKWEVPNAHKGGVTSLFVNNNYILSGGEDGALRVWSRSSHQLLTQFTDNRRTVTRVFPDIKTTHLIHSCGIDRIINTYDLKLERRVVRHEIGSGTIMDMTQRKDSELELVTCGVGNAILFWDCDEANPVQSLPLRGQVNSVEVSPNGQFLAAASEAGELFIFDIRSLTLVSQGAVHSAKVNRLRWSPDQKQIVTVSDDCSIALWNFYG
jgi:WD40 repeat protein